MLEWRLEAYRRWLTMREPQWAQGRLRPDRLSGRLLLFRADQLQGAEVARRHRSRDPQDLREARHPAARARGAARHRARGPQEGEVGEDGEPARRAIASRSTPCSTCVSVATTFKEELKKVRRDLHADLGGAARASRPGEAVSRHGRAGVRQLLRHAQFGGVLRRLVRLRAAGRALPDGALDLFPHQREEHRPVRAHADHRRQGLLRELPRRLHRADARREPAARRGGRADRARRRRDQVFDHPELVSGRRGAARAASTTSSPSAATAAARARRSPGPRSRPARRSPGNIRAASCAATTRAASSIRSRSRTATSRSTAAPR